VERFTQESFKEKGEEPEKEAGRWQRYLVVVNPVSRGGKALKEGVWLLKHLGRLGIRHDAFFTESPGHAERIVARWAEKADVVVAVGGGRHRQRGGQWDEDLYRLREDAGGVSGGNR